MVASVKAAAPTTAITQASIFTITGRLHCAIHMETARECRKSCNGLVDAGPVVGHENRVAGVRWIILHTGGLAGGKTLQAKTLFEAGDILRGFVRDAGDGIAVSNQAAHTVRNSRRTIPALRRENMRGSGYRRGRDGCFDQLDDKAFHNSPDLIELKAAAAFFSFGIFRLPKETLQNHSRGGDDQRRGSDDEPPIDCPVLQRFGFARRSRLEDIAQRLARFLPVFQESFKPPIGEGVLKELFKYFVRHGADVRAHARGRHDVQRMAKTRGQHLRRIIVGR